MQHFIRFALCESSCRKYLKKLSSEMFRSHLCNYHLSFCRKRSALFDRIHYCVRVSRFVFFSKRFLSKVDCRFSVRSVRSRVYV